MVLIFAIVHSKGKHVETDRLAQPACPCVKLFVSPEDEEPHYFAVAFPAPSPYPDIVHRRQTYFRHLYTFVGDLSAMSAKNKVVNHKIVKMFFHLIE
jgi:hypothetical protein